MSKILSLNAFGGLVAAIDASNIPQTNAQDILNANVDRATIRFRNGWRSIANGAATPYSLDYFRGYTSAKAAVSGYASVQGGYLYTIDPNTGTRTEVKTGAGASLSVGTNSYTALPMAQNGYLVTNTGSTRVWKWTLGTANSLVAMNPPTPPTTAPTISQTLGNAANSYSTWSWSGTVAVTGIARSDDYAIASGSITVGHTAASTGAASFEVTIGTAQDWTYNDAFAFLLTLPVTIKGTAGQFPGNNSPSVKGNWSNATAYVVGDVVTATSLSPNDRVFLCRKPHTNQSPVVYTTTDYWQDLGPSNVGSHYDGFGRPSWALPDPVFAIDPASIRVTFTDNSGTVYTPVSCLAKDFGDRAYAVRCDFEKGTRASWSAIKKVKVTYNVSIAEPSNPLYARVVLSPITLGGVNLLPSVDELRKGTSTYNIEAAYSYFNSSTSQESGQSASVVTAYNRGLDPYNVGPLGSWWSVAATTSGDAAVDTIRYYARVKPTDMGGLTQPDFKLAGTSTNASPTFALKQGRLDLSAASAISVSADFSNVVGAASFGTWIIWFRGQGFQNVVHSAIGSPERWPNTSVDRTDDYLRGANYTLSDNGDDEPVAGLRVDDSLILFGTRRVYAQVAAPFVIADTVGANQSGVSPWSMTPPKAIPGAGPIANKDACCLYRDASGNPSCVYLTKAGDLYAVAVGQGFDGTSGYALSEVSQYQRTQIKTFLLDGQSLSDFSTAVVRYDERKDAVWIICKRRAIVWRRTNLLDGERHWEYYSYTLPSDIKYASFEHEVGMRFVLANGGLIEVERNTSTGADITGTNRDGGSAPPNLKWRSKDFLGQNLRVFRVLVQRSDMTVQPTATVYATRQTETITLASGVASGRLSAATQGRSWSVEIGMAETDAEIDRIDIELFAAAVGRNK